MPSKIDNDGATGWYADGIHRYNAKTWGMSEKLKVWPHQGEPYQELQKKLSDRVKGKQLFVGNPAEVRRHVNPDSKEGKEIMERLDRLQGCFDRVHYAPETYDSGKTNFHSDTKQQEYRTKYGTSYAFGSKDWSKRDELVTNTTRNLLYTQRLEKERTAAATAVKSSMAKAGLTVLEGSSQGNPSPASSPSSPSPSRTLNRSGSPRKYASPHAYDQVRDLRVSNSDIYGTTRMGKADHDMTYGTLVTTNLLAAEDVLGASLLAPPTAHYNACQEFFRVTSGSPGGLTESTLVPRQVV